MSRQAIRVQDVGEQRGAFGGFIGPRTLLAQIWNTAPWLMAGARPRPRIAGARRLVDMAQHPLGWHDILRHADRLEALERPRQDDWLEYFAFCLAAHFGTCATHVPTDVDTKIRGHLWFALRDEECLADALDMALALGSWDIRGVSARTLTYEEFGTISGHDGERLGVLAAGHLRFLTRGDEDRAALLLDAIQREVERETRLFRWLAGERGRELEVLRVAANLVHNAGDLDQGLACPLGKRVGDVARERFGRLAHERFERYDGVFRIAAALNTAMMAPEAHRHYPLRRISRLREDPRWLRPAGPFFDDWGRALGAHAEWDDAARGEILAGLLFAEKKVAGQEAYGRALAGFEDGAPGGLANPRLRRHLGGAGRRALKDAELRKKIAVPQSSFESRYIKKTRLILARFGY